MLSYRSVLIILCLCADYVRLMKYGDSLYRCKELKRAALVWSPLYFEAAAFSA